LRGAHPQKAANADNSCSPATAHSIGTRPVKLWRAAVHRADSSSTVHKAQRQATGAFKPQRNNVPSAPTIARFLSVAQSYAPIGTVDALTTEAPVARN
jgi:hypothetical protein